MNSNLAWIAVPALAAAVATALPPPAQAAFPGQNGRILYLSARQDLWTMRPDGSDKRRLTETAAAEGCGAYSPSGRRIAFSRTVAGNTDVYVRNRDGTVFRLTTDPGRDLEPAFSPDGTQIVFSSNRDGNRELFTVRAARVHPAARQLTQTPGNIANTDPEWSPDGTRIAYVRGEPRFTLSDIATLDAATGGDRRLFGFNDAQTPSWSPDGGRIAFAWNVGGSNDWFEIWRMNADGSDVQQVSPGRDEGMTHAPAWSPDGSRIAYTRGLFDGTPAPGIFVTTVDGRAVQRLSRTRDEVVCDWQPLPAPSGATTRMATPAAPTPHRLTAKALLQRYQPVTYFAAGERFTPTSVGAFVRDARLETRDAAGAFVVAHPSPEPDELPAADTALCRAAQLAPCWRLNQRTCSPLQPLGGLECYASAVEHRPAATVVYGRVARPTAGRIVLQYWYFAYDNVYSYENPPSDVIWQAHEGDWEVVNVVLSRAERPVFVGYSQHCTGERRAWSETPRFRGTHPIVHVALGSHANYFAPGTHPIDPHCLPAEALAFFQAAGLPLPVDYAGAASVAGPRAAGGPATAIRRVTTERPRWMRFPGAWGELEAMHAPAPIGTVVTASSPVGPAFHRVWRRPLSTMQSWRAER